MADQQVDGHSMTDRTVGEVAGDATDAVSAAVGAVKGQTRSRDGHLRNFAGVIVTL